MPKGPTPAKTRSQSETDLDLKVIQNAEKNTKISETDVIFCFDTIGKMNVWLKEAQKNFKAIASKLLKHIPKIRIGLIAMRDYCDQQKYVIKYLDFTNKRAELLQWLESIEPTQGDGPKAYELALRIALKRFSWSRGNNKALVMIGDNVPHPPSYTSLNIFWRDELDELTKLGVKVYGVQVGDKSDIEAAHFYEELANRSGGAYIQLNHKELITDMLMAVCYKEYDQKHLEEFILKTKKREGILDIERENMFSELRKESSVSNLEVKNLSYIWWSSQNDTGKCQFTLKSNGKWSPMKKDSKSLVSSLNLRTRKRSSSPSPNNTVIESSMPPRKSLRLSKRKSSDDSDSDSDTDTDTDTATASSPRKKKRSSLYDKGDIVAIRGDDKRTWLGKIKKLSDDSADIQWFDELRSKAGTYVLLKWYDSVPIDSIINTVTIVEDKNRGIFILKGSLP